MSRASAFENLPLVQSEQINRSFRIRDVEIGGSYPVVIAGPCAVESEEQIVKTAEFIKEQGAHGLRGGVFKPRSSPYSFQGLGETGLEYLALAREKTGLFTVIEVTSISQIAETNDYADVLQIGARNMQNFELLKAVGRSNKPVLLKRGLSATIQELLQAAEYILNEGNSRIMLCERGIRTFETITRNTLDINAIPLLKQLTNLPVFADPSHGTGRSDLVTPVAKAVISAGANGLIIEVHPQPEVAMSDGKQSLDFTGFAQLMQQIVPPVEKLPQLEEVSPGVVRFEELTKEYNYIPVYTELITDAETPVTVFQKLTDNRERFLLESVERGEQVGRYSFIGWDPILTVTAAETMVTIKELDQVSVLKQVDPLAVLEQKLQELKVAPAPELGKFFGGAVGFLGYDYVRTIEKLPTKNTNQLSMPDACWVVPKYLARFDHVLHKITLIILTKTEPGNEAEIYQQTRSELQQLLQKLGQPLVLAALKTDRNLNQSVEREVSDTQAEFCEKVDRIKEYINAGDAFQVVLSQRITEVFAGDPLMFYRILRTINPSPYLFYLDFKDYQLTGSSPEVMVRLEDNGVTLKPIAGTRPRGGSVTQDELLRQELLQDEKERAEHTMLVDLGRNDVGRVCRYGSVKVTELMAVENYSHVMHIVSKITGELNPGYSATALLRAVFPAGTLSGAPKVRAMEIIEELEPVRRQFYGGAVGYLGFNGNLDTCITIRTVLFKDGKAHLQVGAGIVADSVGEREYLETMNKAGALLAALERAGGLG